MESKQELLDRTYRLAFKYEAELGSCPQCVLAASDILSGINA